MMAYTDVQQSNSTDRFFELLRQVFILDIGGHTNTSPAPMKTSQNTTFGTANRLVELDPNEISGLVFPSTIQSKKIKMGSSFRAFVLFQQSLDASGNVASRYQGYYPSVASEVVGDKCELQ